MVRTNPDIFLKNQETTGKAGGFLVYIQNRYFSARRDAAPKAENRCKRDLLRKRRSKEAGGKLFLQKINRSKADFAPAW